MSRPVSEATPVWPGDLPWDFTLTWSIAEGAGVNVGAIHGTTHAGTHADAPLHVDPAGAAVDRLPLDAFLGPARLLDLAGGEGLLGVEELAAAVGAGEGPPGPAEPAGSERLLLATGCDWSGGFPTAFRTLSPEAAAWLVTRGVRLVGTDAPSVDPLGSETLPVHRALARNGVAILEGLALAGIEPGRYELVALPLRLVGADASPVRAAIRRAGE